MKNLRHGMLLLFFLICTGFTKLCSGQSYTDSLQQDEHTIIGSVAPYPPAVRSLILDVAQYPQALVKIERVQARSSQSFQDLLAGYSRDEQEKFYEISRFPAILNQIVTKNDVNDVKSILKDLPSGTQSSIMDVYTGHYDDLVKMNNIYLSSQTTLQKILSGYPENVKEEFRKVIDMPDIMNLLTDNIGLTVELGEAYKTDPVGIVHQLDSLNNSITEQSSADLNAYKKDVEHDPQLQDEMKKAADDFSSSNSQPDNPTYVTNTYYDNTPYPYWFSYPYWYTSPMWYPRPLYYYTGFYYGQGGRIVITGFPSRTYSNWFYGYGYRRYPNLYRHYGNYYSLHRTNIRNINVYRGFNEASYRHFTGGRNRSMQNNGNGNLYQNRMRNTTNATWGAVRMNQMRPANFNNHGFDHFHANSYHTMGWQHVNAPRMGGAPHMNGNGGRSGGGGSRRGR